MPYITAISSANLIGFGLSNSLREFLYIYNSSTPAAWTTLANWYKDLAHTTQSSEFPASSKYVRLLSDAVVDLENWSAPGRIDLNGFNLTLQYHPIITSEQAPGYTCAAPYNFNIEILDIAGGNLIVDGHINIV